jgi:hypothetical protein
MYINMFYTINIYNFRKEGKGRAGDQGEIGPLSLQRI